MPMKPLQHRPKFQPVRTENRGSAASRGYDRTWQEFRRIFLLQHATCFFANDPRHAHECTLAATVVDHITPLTRGGARLDPNNCRACCRTAHDRITQNFVATGVNELPEKK